MRWKNEPTNRKGEPTKYRSGADAKEAVKILQFVRSEEPKQLARNSQLACWKSQPYNNGK